MSVTLRVCHQFLLRTCMLMILGVAIIPSLNM